MADDASKPEALPVTVSCWLADERLRPGRQVFAIGDVHGHPAPLEALLEEMAAQTVRPAVDSKKSHLVLLGDLIDRGPDSPGAIATAAHWVSGGRFDEATLLLGNHDLFYHAAARLAAGEEPFETALAIGLWMQNNGQAMLDQLGAQTPGAVRERLIEAIGAEAVATYEAAQSHLLLGNLLFVHAGVDPRTPLARWFAGQARSAAWVRRGDRHWAWIRREFCFHQGAFEGKRIVVHGHTPEARILRWKRRPEPDPLHQIDGWRLGLDGTRSSPPTITGAQLEDGRYRIFTVPIDA